jgi:hypothetical protein
MVPSISTSALRTAESINRHTVRAALHYWMDASFGGLHNRAQW